MMAKQMKEANKTQGAQFEISYEYEMKLEMLKHLFEMLRIGHRISDQVIKCDNLKQLRGTVGGCAKKSEQTGFTIDMDALYNPKPAQTLRGNTTTWQRIKATSGFRAEW